MWWPAIGGIVVGLGGWIFPQALGVGYDIIGNLVTHNLPATFLLGILFFKSVMWAVSLGSGTSAGVLAPLLMMGGALGGLGALFLPHEGIGFWPLISMGAVLGGTMRSPFTGIVFVLELTDDFNVFLPLVLAVTIAHGFTVLTMRRSILTEKVSRRGYHLSREYAVDPLEVLFVREVMRTDVAALQSSIPLKELGRIISKSYPRLSQGLYPVADREGDFVGVLTRSDVQKYVEEQSIKQTGARVADVLRSDPIKAYLDEPLTVVVNRMAETGLTAFPVVERSNPQKLLGLVSLYDLLKARVRRLQEEHRRERVFPLHLVFPRGTRRPPAASTEHARLGVNMKKEAEANWARVRNPDHWDGVTDGFNKTNAKMVCKKCHREFPFDWKCPVCGSAKMVLGTAAETPGIFCSVCHNGQWHWDCPSCGRRQDFASSFFYNKKAMALGVLSKAA